MFEKFRLDINRVAFSKASQEYETYQTKGNNKLANIYLKKMVQYAKNAIKFSEKIKDSNEKRAEARTKLVNSYKKFILQYEKLDETKIIKKNLESIANKFDTLGKGTEVERYAQLAIQGLEVAYRRLDKPGQLKLIYFEMGGKEMLPPKAKSILEKYVDNKIDLNQAKQEFEEVIQGYKKIFSELGINPTESKFIFGKFPPKDKPNNSD